MSYERTGDLYIQDGNLPGFIGVTTLSPTTVARLDPNLVSIWGLVQPLIKSSEPTITWLYVDYGNVVDGLTRAIADLGDFRLPESYLCFTWLDPSHLDEPARQLASIRRKVKPAWNDLRLRR